MKTQSKDLTGVKIGRLTIIGPTPERRWGQVVWECVCECGARKNIPRQSFSRTKSCGCLNAEISRKRSSTHGDSKSPEYATWRGVLSRCTRENCVGYENYGGRGITVCDRWLSYDNFIADMGRRPTRKHSIDRIDVNGNYEPGNCRWATKIEQNRNRRDNLIIQYRGESRALAQWCEDLGLHYHRTICRLLSGRSADDAFRQGRMPSKRKQIMVEYRGATKPLWEWCRELGLIYGRTKVRIKLGFTAEEAFVNACTGKRKNRKNKDVHP